MKLAYMSYPGEKQETLSPETAQQLLASGGQLIDVRPPSDFEAGTLPGAMNLPLDSLLVEHSRLNKHQPVILYCTRGLLCSRAARTLASLGFLQIYHFSLH